MTKSVQDESKAAGSLRILRPRRACAMLGIGKTQFNHLARTDPTFPKKIALGARAVGVLESDLRAWIESRVRRDAA